MEKGFAIMNGKEDPVMYFTKSDYKSSVRPASYSVKTLEVKETPGKQAQKKITKKKGKTKSGRYAKKHKAKENTKVEAKGAGGDKG
jgi:hypothetical protein